MLNLTIVELHVANGNHNGVARVLLDQYLNQRTQKAIDAIVASNKDIADATLLPEQKILVVQVAEPTHDPDVLKDAVRGLSLGIADWFNNLDANDKVTFTAHSKSLQQEEHEDRVNSR